MYAMLRQYDGVKDPGETVRLVNKSFVPLISKTPGLAAYYLIDAGDDKLISVSIFKTKSAAEESNKKAAGWVQENIASLLPNAPKITAGEVVATKRTPPIIS